MAYVFTDPATGQECPTCHECGSLMVRALFVDAWKCSNCGHEMSGKGRNCEKHDFVVGRDGNACNECLKPKAVFVPARPAAFRCTGCNLLSTHIHTAVPCARPGCSFMRDYASPAPAPEPPKPVNVTIEKIYVTVDDPDRFVSALSQAIVAGPTATGSASHRHRYFSTACMHGEHAQCRRRCKFCDVACVCSCHEEPPAE